MHPAPPKLRWGVLGTAGIAASAYVPAIRASRNGTLHAVASRSLEKASLFAQTHGFARAHGSYEELLADPEVDAVYIPLPNALHAPWAIKAAAAGKPTLVEKPLAGSTREAEAMAAAFKASTLPLCEALMYRLHPLTLEVERRLRAGDIGPLRAVRSSFFADVPDGANIRYQSDLAGGALRDLGCYCVSVIRLMAGQEPDTVEAVADFSASGVDLRLAGILRFPNGIVGDFSCGFGTPFNCSYDLIGEHGRMLVDHGAMVAWPGEAFRIQLWNREGHQVITIPAANHYQSMVESFGDCVIKGTPPPVPLEESLNNLRALDRLLASAGRA